MLGIVLVLIIAVATALVAQLNQRRINNSGATLSAGLFEEAREALLGYAYSYPEIVGDPLQSPGRFPCPAASSEGK